MWLGLLRDVADLRHHLFVDVEAAGGIENHRIQALSLRHRQRILANYRRRDSRLGVARYADIGAHLFLGIGRGRTLTVNGGAGDDILTVNDPAVLPTGGLIFHGGPDAGGGDSLTLAGGSATTVTHTVTSAGDGASDIDGSVLNYTGLEPITDNMNNFDPFG